MMMIHSEISPLEGVINRLFERIRHTALNNGSKKYREAHEDYVQRRNDLYAFLEELENNPLEFPIEKIEELRQAATLLERQLDMIGFYLDMMAHSPETVLESMDIYLKKHKTISVNLIETELSEIKNTVLRESLLNNKSYMTECLQNYSIMDIRKTVDLLNQYFEETPEDKQSYKAMLYFLHHHHAGWMPVGEEMYNGVIEKKPETDILINKDAELKKIERKVAALELEIIPEAKKPEKLREIEQLKYELSKMGDFSAEITALQAKLEKLSGMLIPKRAGIGFFGE